MAFDFDAAVQAPFRMQPGLRKLAPGTRQLHALAPGSAVHAEKLAVLAHAPEEALLVDAGFDGLPALQALAAEAAAQQPSAFTLEPEGVLAERLGWRLDWSGADLQPLERPDAASGACLRALPQAQRLAGLLSLALHEDIAVVDGRRGSLALLAVCLPSHWAPRDKLGRSFAEAHAPVADNATLLAAGRHLLRLVCEAQRWERFVWTVTPHGLHDQHPARHPRCAWPLEPQELADAAWWRTEHQSFVPLPALGQALFLIHVDVQPLGEAVATPARAAALHAALASMSDAVLAYRGLREARAPLLAWLAQRAAAA